MEAVLPLLTCVQCGGNAPQTRGLQNQKCILTLKEAESKDKAWEGLVSDKLIFQPPCSLSEGTEVPSSSLPPPIPTPS